jgi:hypothetical protein
MSCLGRVIATDVKVATEPLSLLRRKPIDAGLIPYVFFPHRAEVQMFLFVEAAIIGKRRPVVPCPD